MGRKIKKNYTLPSARVGTRQRGLCRVPAHLALGKEAFAECRPTWHSAKAVALADPNPATWQAFAECLTAGHSAKGTTTDAVCPGPPLPSAPLCRVPGTRQRSPLPSASLYRVPDTRQRDLCRVRGLALGKEPLCRVPVVCYSTKLAALGKVTVSHSVLCPRSVHI